MSNTPKFPNKNRYDYQRMTAAEFKADLDELGWTEGTFAGMFGSTPRRVKDYIEGRENIPIWVPVVLHVLKTVPGALGASRSEVDRRIIRDNRHEQWKQKAGEQ